MTWARGIAAPLLSRTLPASALLVPLCPQSSPMLTMVNIRKNIKAALAILFTAIKKNSGVTWVGE
jgi:hypothetical protein